MTSWDIGNKTVQSLVINNKEVKTIKRLSDNVIIYNKSSASVISEEIVVNSVTQQSGKFGTYYRVNATYNHLMVANSNYSDNLGNSIIRIYTDNSSYSVDTYTQSIVTSLPYTINLYDHSYNVVASTTITNTF